jgi:hypothetical protein
MKDGQLCMIKESQELCRFIGNMNGDYSCSLGVIEDCFGYIKIVKMSDIQAVTDTYAKDVDPIMYSILMEGENDD